ncbi:hypothetical protein [Nocardiopsis sp. NRRL B-16309]|uniref:hypothetical protein n=1 Tax=Nocardiopsis sp. NRRL B-16309 TaxID=1519494 RepID=UPI0006AEE6BD|nr:hypothetical protein [Nocardiopsis sp. NRRL B-16309]KOX14020.1 hypothetical protein ADL05_17420 [Nocardiopsis sp. NRRL B-16309]
MGLIDNMWKKGKTGDSSDGSEAVASPSGDGKKRTKRRKPEEMLASVVRESTVNAAIDLLSRNERFVLPGGNSWAALALPVENIGGLSKKHQKDEAKGSLIELINHDLIQTVTTRQLLDEEVLGIIPTAQTLERMSEYSILTGATYYWMVLSPSQDRQELVVGAVIDEGTTYAEAVAIADGSSSLADRLPQMWAWTQAIDATATPMAAPNGANAAPSAATVATPAPTPQPPAAPPSPPVPPGPDHIDRLPGAVSAAPTPGASVDEEQPEGGPLADGEFSADLFDEGPGDDESDAYDDAYDAYDDAHDDDAHDDEVDDDGAYEDEADEGGTYDDTDEESEEDEGRGSVTEGEGAQDPAWTHYAEQNRDREFTEEQVRETIARRFLSDDLGLEIPYSEFEAAFDTRAPSVRLEFGDEVSDWLGEQIAVMAEQANTELTKLHSDHRRALRQFFVETMSLHAESVTREVDEHHEGSVYHTLSAAAEQEFADLKARVSEDVGTRRAEITRRYEKDAEERAEVAAAHARQVFWDRFRPELERKLADVAPEIERRNEERYAHQRRRVLEMRRKDAHTRMRLGTTRTFQLLAEREAKQREAEMELLEQWNAKLTRFINDNLKHDIARAEVLAEQLRLDNQIEELQAEHALRVEELNADRENRVRRLEAELERERERAEARLREREGGWRHEADIKDEKLRSANQLYKDLHAQMQDMADSMHRQYRGRIDELEGDKRSYIEELKRTSHVHSRFIKLLVVLAAVLVLISIAVGVIVGWTLGYGSTTSASAMIIPVWVV